MIIALQALYLFRKSLLTIFEQIVEPYFKNIFSKSTDVFIEEDSDDDVYAEFDDNKGVVFYPPVYTQRYAAVSDCLLDTRWRGQLEKVIDFGCNDMSFIKCLKDITGIREILGVDLEPIPTTLDLKQDNYNQKRENPLKITVYQGNAADPDYRLIGCDAVLSIEMIEHMLPHDLERFVHNIFGFIKPWVVVITTPNGDFNVLFKALETNGLRRLDHMFEWSRQQFHDWCSNIVTRYPEYSVSCKGIGPGPPGTAHLGCCSQLALFVSANYQKQTELSPNSLALVERVPGSAMSDSMDSWDMTESLLDNRLNCTNNQVKRFSKTTQQVMAKNKLDTLANNKDVFGDIRQLSKVASSVSQETIWKNINWGEDAPYWNKYYKIVKEYSYPFAAKSDETRILEVISEEIHRLMYSSGEELLFQDDKMEIPIGYIMGVVSHITDDEDKVRELLEWNGYEVIGSTVVYTKLVEDDLPVDVQKDWIDVESVSDLASTDSQSFMMLENVSERDMFEYDLQISLDQRIRSLQKLSKRKDLSSELDRLVGRLVNLVQDTRWSESPTQPTWLLHKLYDLLTVTEKAMMTQRRNFIGDCKRALQFRKRYKENQNIIITIEKTCPNRPISENILERYESIVLSLGNLQSLHNFIYGYSDDENMSLDDADRENKAIQSYDSLDEELELREIKYKKIEKADAKTCMRVDSMIIDKNAKTISCNRYNDDEGIIVIKAKRKSHSKFIEHQNKSKRKKYKKIRKFTCFAPGYTNYFKNKTIQYHQQNVKLRKKQNYCTPMCESIKPIPGSLMNLLNLSRNKIDVSRISSIGDIELSEPESLVTVKHLEDVAVDRTIDTERNILPKSEKKDVESIVAETVSCHAKTNIQGVRHTPILNAYDINEPSTSDGIRHVSADIQCGPDDVMDVFQTSLSLNYTLNKRLNTDLKIQAIEDSDFQKSIGIVTSNSPSLISKEHVTDLTASKKYELHEETVSVTESVFNKHIMENRDTILKPRETIVNSRRPALSYSGIYVYSYKNRNFEDIVYQGKWHECNSKKVIKKTPIIIYRGRKETIVKKNNIVIEKKILNKSTPPLKNREYKKKISFCNSVPITVAHIKPEKHICLDHSKKKNRHFRLVKRSVGIRPLETSTPVTKFFDTSHIFDIKSYIPEYLKRRLNKQRNKKLKLNLNMVSNNDGKQLHKLHNLDSAGNIQTARYKLNRKTPIYQVYRNEVNKEIIDLRVAENEKAKKCISASTSSYVPCSSCSNNISNYGIGFSGKQSTEKYEPENYKNIIKRVQKLKNIKNVKAFASKLNNVEHTTIEETSCCLEAKKSPGLRSGVQGTETSGDLSFSNDGWLKYKHVTNSASNTHAEQNTQTPVGAYKVAFDEAEMSNEYVQMNKDNNIEEQIRHLIDESLNHIGTHSTVDKKDEVHNLNQVADDKDSVYTEYTSILTLPTTSAARTKLLTRVESGSKMSIGYSNIDSGVQDVELLSPVSFASLNTSKFSEYLSADNEFEEFSSFISDSKFSLPRKSFDLKDVSNPPEISQRSSVDTYMSCSSEDDTQMLYWLFESDSEPERLVTSPPLEDEMEDSEDETEDYPQVALVGISAGAGDGRGIHSDVSRDTSGRGTSLSSSASDLDSQETLSNASSQDSFDVGPQDAPDNNEPPNVPVETDNSSNMCSTPPLANDTGGDTSSLDNEHELDSETSYCTM